ncbi:hypothetical protein SESBI_11208 [Sesbania bispinosa]|nr:hypothetical protein SESBI_11208 [Sesbania bispinosa]
MSKSFPRSLAPFVRPPPRTQFTHHRAYRSPPRRNNTQIDHRCCRFVTVRLHLACNSTAVQVDSVAAVQ